MKRPLLTLVCLQLMTAPAAAQSGTPTASSPRFGSVLQAGSETSIRWEDASQAELSEKELRLTRTGASIRSEPLALIPLQLYRVGTTMARGPGSTPRFVISYLDAQGKTIEWLPAWQHKTSAHANWMPLSPHAQRYVQGFALPLGATQPQLVLRLDAGDKGLARYSSWTLSELRIEALGKVPCCERVGDDLLLNGDFELGSSEGLPKHWVQWAPSPENRVELIELRDEPTRKHVLRFRPRTAAQLASRYLAPVAPGHAYRFSVMVRGQGRVELDIHSLTRDRPIPLRVGNHAPGAGSFDVDTNTWRELSMVWVAEAPNIAHANVVIAVSAQTTIELDTVELRPFAGTSAAPAASSQRSSR